MDNAINLTGGKIVLPPRESCVSILAPDQRISVRRFVVCNRTHRAVFVHAEFADATLSFSVVLKRSKKHTAKARERKKAK